MVDERERAAAEVPPPSPEDALQVGRTFAHFQLTRELGRGGQGVVFLAEDELLGRLVALKMLSGGAAVSRQVRERFRREAETAGRLEHPGICGVHEVGEHEGIPYIAMQYVRGITLADLVARARHADDGAGLADEPDLNTTSTTLTGKNALGDVLELFERIANALHAAHEAGLIHRDIKPGNVMITPEGQPVLLDFGLARDLDSDEPALTETGQVLGTPSYMSAEQLLGRRDQIDRRTDVYSLGAMLYECLTLRQPFEGPGFEQLYHQVLEGAPIPPRRLNPRIPVDLATVVEVAMERDLERRYATARDLAEDLRRVRAFESIQAKPAGPVLRARKWIHRKPAHAVGLGSAVLLAGLGSGTWVRSGIERKSSVREHIESAEEHLLSGDFSSALEDVAVARDLDANSTRALELKARIEAAVERAAQEQRERDDLSEAMSAREEAAQLLLDYAAARERARLLETEIEEVRARVESDYAPRLERGAFAARRADRDEAVLQAERHIQRAREALERAARREAPWGRTAATDAAFADFYMLLWREAVEAGDEVRAEVYRDVVEQHDTEETHRAELLGRGALTIASDLADAELFLFRYESYETIRADDPIPRLVPVPTTGVGRVREASWIPGFHPGDPCLSIVGVDDGSPAARAGLREGDLVVAVAGRPSGQGLLLRAVEPEGSLAAAGAEPGMRIVELNGEEVESRWDWAVLERGERAVDLVSFDALATPVSLERSLVDWVEPRALAEGVAAATPLSLTCLRDGEPVPLEVRPGEPTGLHTEVTVYPLICSPENRVVAGARVEADAGSYLLVGRAAGFETLRSPVVVPRGEPAHAELRFHPRGSTPPGFVHVPGGPFPSGGDPAARDGAPARVVDVPDTFIARRELTNREWNEFLEDPETRRRMAGLGDADLRPAPAVGSDAPREPRRALDSRHGGLLARRTGLPGVAQRARRAGGRALGLRSTQRARMGEGRARRRRSRVPVGLALRPRPPGRAAPQAARPVGRAGRSRACGRVALRRPGPRGPSRGVDARPLPRRAGRAAPLPTARRDVALGHEVGPPRGTPRLGRRGLRGRQRRHPAGGAAARVTHARPRSAATGTAS